MQASLWILSNVDLKKKNDLRVHIHQASSHDSHLTESKRNPSNEFSSSPLQKATRCGNNLLQTEQIVSNLNNPPPCNVKI